MQVLNWPRIVADAGWIDVRLGLSGAAVQRSADGGRFRKSVVGERAKAELIAERDRLLWLAQIGFPAARVLDWNDAAPEEPGPAVAAAGVPGPAVAAAGVPGPAVAAAGVPGPAVAAAGVPGPAVAAAGVPGSWTVLVTSAVPGIPISSVSRHDARGATRSLALLLRELHAVPAASCPFDRTLLATLAAAQQAVTPGPVDAADFDDERLGRPSSEALGQLLADVSRAFAAERPDLVVCHGDACLPNVLVDPDTLRPTGIVDVGRLGVADRHQDLALATRSLADLDLNPAFGSGCADLFVDTYVSAMGLDPFRVDAGRLMFYRLLDEFF